MKLKRSQLIGRAACRSTPLSDAVTTITTLVPNPLTQVRAKRFIFLVSCYKEITSLRQKFLRGSYSAIGKLKALDVVSHV